MTDKRAFIDQHMMDFRGRDYLPVAPRVVLFRKDHPEWAIVTETVLVGDDVYIKATVVNDAGRIVQTAHKKVKSGGRGPAKDWPLETAETGAIGRALAGVGYGTLSGDLDEGDQISDAPVDRELASSGLAESYKSELEAVTTEKELLVVRNKIATLDRETKEKLKEAYDEAKARVG